MPWTGRKDSGPDRPALQIVADVAREVVIAHGEPGESGESGYASVVEHAANARVEISEPGAEVVTVDFARAFR